MLDRVRRLVVIVLVAGLVYAALVAAADARALLGVLRAFHAWAFAAALALTMGAYALRDARWLVYMRRLRVALPLRERLYLGLASGKFGQVLKSYYLNERAGTPYQTAIPATFAERMSDVIAIIVLLLLALIAGPRFRLWQLAVAVGLLVVFLVVVRSSAVASLAAGVLHRVPRWRSWAEHLEASHANFRVMLRPAPLALPVAIGLVAYVMEATALWLLVRYGLGSHAVQWAEAAFALAAADILGTVSLIPGGLGVTEGGLVVSLRVFGLGLAEAAAAALLLRIVTLWLSAALDGAAVLALHVEAGVLSGRVARHEGPAPRAGR